MSEIVFDCLVTELLWESVSSGHFSLGGALVITIFGVGTMDLFTSKTELMLIHHCWFVFICMLRAIDSKLMQCTQMREMKRFCAVKKAFVSNGNLEYI